jgi:DNA repair exonuclease SbcCD ATPase subunit
MNAPERTEEANLRAQIKTLKAENERLKGELEDIVDVSAEYPADAERIAQEAAAQLKADGEEIERLTKDRKNLLDERDNAVGLGLETGRDWMAQNAKLKGELARHKKWTNEWQADCYEAEAKLDTLQKQNAELREILKRIVICRSAEEARELAVEVLTPQPNLPTKKESSRASCPVCGWEGPINSAIPWGCPHCRAPAQPKETNLPSKEKEPPRTEEEWKAALPGCVACGECGTVIEGEGELYCPKCQPTKQKECKEES